MVVASTYLVDTGILLRISRPADPNQAIVDAALATLAQASAELVYTHQNIAEFWNVCTRPLERNGIGLSVAKTVKEVQVIERTMRLLPDSEAVYREWRRLVETHAVSGAKVHDARLVASMVVHGVTHLLTLNPGDFARYPEITAIHPGALAGT